MKKLVGAVLALVAVWVAVAACGLLTPQQPAPPVIVNNTGGDGGLTVLLTVAMLGGFVFVVAAVAFGLLWASERRRRGAAEDVLAMLTGRPVSESTLMTVRQLGVAPVAIPALYQGPVAERKLDPGSVSFDARQRRDER